MVYEGKDKETKLLNFIPDGCLTYEEYAGEGKHYQLFCRNGCFLTSKIILCPEKLAFNNDGWLWKICIGAALLSKYITCVPAV